MIRPTAFRLDSLYEPGFSWSAAVSLGFASKLSYRPASAIEKLVLDWGFDDVHFLERHEAQAFFCRADGVVLLAFRGAECIGDWLGNLQIASTNSPGGPGEVHLGLLEGYKALQGQIRKLLDAPNGPDNTRLWLTGHGPGGALATIAAADLGKTWGIRTCTFGQPRTGNPTFEREFNRRSGKHLLRFVNGEDLVTRLPPGWSHVGTPVWLGESLRPPRSAGESEESDARDWSMSESEFSELQSEIHSVRAALLEGADSQLRSRGSLDASIEGMFPSLGHHNIDHYIAAVRRRVGDATLLEDRAASYRSARVFGFTRRAAVARSGIKPILEAVPTPGSGEMEVRATFPGQELPLLLRVSDPAWTPPPGIEVVSRIGNFISARVEPLIVAALEADAGVLALEASRDAGVEQLTTSLPFVNGDKVHRPPTTELGDSALIGVIDSGLDVLHEAFSNAHKRSRILAIWDQRDPTGPSPKTIDPSRFKADYGTVYTKANIDAMTKGNLATPKALRDPEGHGTHVTSIAAGRAVGSCPEGMAPAAGILAVFPHMKTMPGHPPSIGYSSSHMEALDFLLCTALGGNALLSKERPIAINVSLGTNAGAHDGTSLLEGVFDAATSNGGTPGQVIVQSAGNERDKGGHARIRPAEGGIETVRWESPDEFRFQDYIEIWYDAFDQLGFTVTDPLGNASPMVSRNNPSVDSDLGGNRCLLTHSELHSDNGDNLVQLTILPGSLGTIRAGEWTLTIVGNSVSSQEPTVDVWVERGDTQPISFDPREHHVTLSIPATATTVICVAACRSSSPLQLVPSSSYGRTRDGRSKPDICAPGFKIEAARSAQQDHRATRVLSGTSMAAPHVAGALALILSWRQKNSPTEQYNAQQLRKALLRTAKHRQKVHHEGYGWGALDAAALVELLK